MISTVLLLFGDSKESSLTTARYLCREYFRAYLLMLQTPGNSFDACLKYETEIQFFINSGKKESNKEKKESGKKNKVGKNNL